MVLPKIGRNGGPRRRLLLWPAWLCWALLLAPGLLLAEEGGSRYVKICKDMVVNYGDPSLSRLKYLKFAVDVRVENAEVAAIVSYHQPALLDSLVILFSAQSDVTVHSPEGKEEIRQLALAELRRIIKHEEGQEYIQDLLFSRFIVQR